MVKQVRVGKIIIFPFLNTKFYLVAICFSIKAKIAAKNRKDYK